MHEKAHPAGSVALLLHMHQPDYRDPRTIILRRPVVSTAVSTTLLLLATLLSSTGFFLYGYTFPFPLFVAFFFWPGIIIYR